MTFKQIGVCLACLVAAFQSWSQSPSPRSARDITALLDSYQPDPQRVAAEKAELGRPAPSDDSLKSTLLAYWEGRAAISESLGLFSSEMEARRKLVALSQDGAPGSANYLANLATREFYAGNMSEALRLNQQLFSSSAPGIRAVANARAALIFASQGEMAAAEEHVRRSESEFQTALADPSTARWYAKLFAVVIESTRGLMLAAKGRPAEAEVKFHQAVKLINEDFAVMAARSAASPGAPPAAILEQAMDLTVARITDVQKQQGHYIDADWTLRQRLADNLKRVGRAAPGTAMMINGLAAVYAEQGRYADAILLAKSGLDGIVRSGTPPESSYVLDTRLTLAKAHVGLEQWREAALEFRLIAEAAKGAAAGHLAASGSPEIAVALVRSGDAKSSLEMMRTITQRLEASLGPNHYRTGEARGVLAMALAKSADKDAALKLFREALATMLEFEALADEAASAGLRRLKLVWVIEAYLELLAERHKSGDTEAAAEAFRVADVARAQRVQRALTSSAVRASVGTPELADLVRKEQDLGHEVASLYKFLSEQLLRPADQQLPKVMSDMRGRIERIAGERSGLLKQIEQRFPAYANLISPKPPTLVAARQSLQEGEALVTLYSAEDATYLWAMRKEGDVSFATVAVPRSELQGRIAKLLEGVKVSSPYADALPKFDVALAHELHETLLEPVAPGWKGAKSLLVVPHGPAAIMPFGVLATAAAPASSGSGLLFTEYRSVPWLAREASITQLPSVNALVTLRAQPPSKSARLAFAGFGDPIFNPKQAPAAKTEVAARGIPLEVRSAAQTSSLASARLANLPRLPDTAEEIRALAQTLGAPEAESVYLDRRANEKEVKSASLANRRILAFATHGLVAGDLDGLTQPALALTAPEVAGVDGDGLLTMEEVLALKLDADWVILSACNTAAGEGAGAEAISGLGRAFFYAGSRSLLVSNWPVETVSAKKLTASTVERYAKANLPRAESLRQAMLELLDQGEAPGSDGKPVYAYAHPLFWAPFSVIGEGN